jgi:Protein NO VEIN, C-terminal
MDASPEWDLSPGDVIRRSSLHDRYGGNRQGGISPSRKSANVFVFAGASGREHGYVDRIGEDGLFHYTGEGQSGDQSEGGGNRSLLEHQADGRALRVFLGVGGEITYVGEFEVDSGRPVYETEAASTGRGPTRKVLVFRLRPLAGAKMPLLDRVYGDPYVPSETWNRYEIDRLVETYTSLLLGEIDGLDPDELELVTALRPQLPGRLEDDIRRQLQNVSAVLSELGSDWFEPYDPLPGPSEELRAAVAVKMGRGARVSDSLAAYADAALAAPGTQLLSFADVLVPPPSSSQPSKRSRGVRIVGGSTSALDDFRRSQLGDAGEEWVVRLEKRRLKELGLGRYADRVEWVSRDSDRYGYDIKSFRADRREMWIEVKTTTRGIKTPFFITKHEVETSVEHPDKYSLYRVHGWARRPRIYTLDGSVEKTSRLEPAVFRGYPL